MHRIS